ncbi:hypothetical protein BVRB_3g057050 [Beta vulgaris subsp. vulgaris]|nr:hypothetical protein BVRB_3g057050 [Beta vulgaris subsp. vulgaris]
MNGKISRNNLLWKKGGGFQCRDEQIIQFVQCKFIPVQELRKER